jgi:hypothetical protein
MNNNDKVMEIRNLVKSIYDFQKLRIAVGGRIIALFYGGLEKQEAEEEAKSPKKKTYDKVPQDLENAIEDGSLECESEEDKAAKKLEKENGKRLVLITNEFKRITDSIADKGITVRKYFNDENRDDKYFRTESLYKFFEHYHTLLKTEEKKVSDLEKLVKTHPLWEAFFEQVKGCGPLMSGVCLSYFDVYKARHCSSFWKYAGLDVIQVPNEDGSGFHGEGRGMKHAKNNIVKYIDKHGDEKEKASLGYNPFLKTKLIGVLGTNLIRANGYYYDIFKGYRARLEQRPDLEGDKKKIVRYRMAMRYMVKMFIRDLWVEWRTVEGLPVSEPYEVAKLGMRPHGE